MLNNPILHCFGIYHYSSDDIVTGRLVGLALSHFVSVCRSILEENFGSNFVLVDFGVYSLDEAKFHFNCRKPVFTSNYEEINCSK